MEPAKQILSKHWRVTPGVTEMESDCEEWRIFWGGNVQPNRKGSLVSAGRQN